MRALRILPSPTFATARADLMVRWYDPAFCVMQVVPSLSVMLNSPMNGTLTIWLVPSVSLISTVTLLLRVLSFPLRLAILRRLRSALFVLVMLNSPILTIGLKVRKTGQFRLARMRRWCGLAGFDGLLGVCRLFRFCRFSVQTGLTRRIDKFRIIVPAEIFPNIGENLRIRFKLRGLRIQIR